MVCRLEEQQNWSELHSRRALRAEARTRKRKRNMTLLAVLALLVVLTVTFVTLGAVSGKKGTPKPATAAKKKTSKATSSPAKETAPQAAATTAPATPPVVSESPPPAAAPPPAPTRGRACRREACIPLHQGRVHSMRQMVGGLRRLPLLRGAAVWRTAARGDRRLSSRREGRSRQSDQRRDRGPGDTGFLHARRRRSVLRNTDRPRRFRRVLWGDGQPRRSLCGPDRQDGAADRHGKRHRPTALRDVHSRDPGQRKLVRFPARQPPGPYAVHAGPDRLKVLGNRLQRQQVSMDRPPG